MFLKINSLVTVYSIGLYRSLCVVCASVCRKTGSLLIITQVYVSRCINGQEQTTSQKT